MTGVAYPCDTESFATPKSGAGRYVFIDGLRGLAALLVALFHLFLGGPSASNLATITPSIAWALLSRGYLGVPIFFVISGFVIAHSINGKSMTKYFSAQFVLRRSLRLDPPYWFTLFLVITLNVFSNSVAQDRTSPTYDPLKILSNMFYIQNIFGSGDILVVAWSMCLEVQFYLVLITVVALSQKLVLNPILICAPLYALSLVLNGRGASTASGVGNSAWFPTLWYGFYLGAVTCWVVRKRISERVWVCHFSVLGVLVVLMRDEWGAVVLATSGLLWFAHRRHGLHSWLRQPAFQYLGGISYSLYLLHTVIGGRIENWGFRLTQENATAALAWVGAALLASLAAAHMMRAWIEIPGIRLGARLGKTLFGRLEEANGDIHAGPLGGMSPLVMNLDPQRRGQVERHRCSL